jgi:3-hydroxyisobutyrate dehydrogenase-like beta-hydroxyacid dehydrogenase
MENIGIIGVGLVGTAMAERLLGGGYGVIGYDIRSEQMTLLEQIGGRPASSPEAVAAACERIVLSLPTSAIVADVLEGLASHLKPGSLIVDTTTGAPEDAATCARVLGESGVDYVDATVGGSSRQVRNCEAIFICGATPEAFTRCTDLFQQCGKGAYHVGPPGSGARMKLVMNLVLGLNRAVLAEGLEFARATGIDPYVALDVLKASPAYSRAMDTKGLRMLNEEFEPEARLSQHLKDVRLILNTGRQFGAHLPLSTLHRDLLEAAEEAGFGASDNSAVIKAYQAAAPK